MSPVLRHAGKFAYGRVRRYYTRSVCADDENAVCAVCMSSSDSRCAKNHCERKQQWAGAPECPTNHACMYDSHARTHGGRSFDGAAAAAAVADVPERRPTGVRLCVRARSLNKNISGQRYEARRAEDSIHAQRHARSRRHRKTLPLYGKR